MQQWDDIISFFFFYPWITCFYQSTSYWIYTTSDFFSFFVFIVWWLCESGTGGVWRDKRTNFVTFECVVCFFCVGVQSLCAMLGCVVRCGRVGMRLPGDMIGQRLQWPKSWTDLNFRLFTLQPQFLNMESKQKQNKEKMCGSLPFTETDNSF